MVALATSSGSRIDENPDETESDADLMDRDEMIDENSLTDCSTNCEASNDYEMAHDEAMVEEESFKNHVEEKKPAINLKDGKTCRLKTEGEKLSKIIRKTGTAKQKALEENIEIENFDSTKEVGKIQSTFNGKAKRDLRSQVASGKKQNQQKVHGKKNVKTTSGATKGDNNNNKKKNSSSMYKKGTSMGNKKDTSTRVKSSKKFSKKKTPKSEL